MADYDKFNPSVPNVGPGDYDVTRPISQPEANKGLGSLFAGVGEGLKNVGELVKDTTKLVDFTNKEDLSNKISLDLNAQRDRHIVDLEQQNRSLVAGNPPVGLSGLPGKVNTLAAAKAQNKVDDVYFRGRVDDLAKQYRAAYPGYRDFIDHTFEKAGFGNPANAYMSALEKANQGLEAALGQQKSKTLDLLYTHGKEIKNAAGLIDALNSGRMSESQVNAEVFPQLKTHFDTEQRQHQFSIEAADQKNRETQATKLVTDNANQDLTTTMNSPAVQAITARMEKWSRDPNSVDENQALADAAYLDHLRVGLVLDARKRDSTEHTFKTIDPDGQVIDTANKYTNNGLLGESYAGTVSKAFQPLADIVDRLRNKDFGYAKASASMVQASQDEYAKRVFGGEYGQIWQAAKFAEQTGPQWWRDFVKVPITNAAGGFMTKGLQSLVQGSVWPTFAPNPPPITKQMDRLNDAGVNNPTVNKAILDNAPKVITHPKAPPEVKANVVQSYFGSTNPSILDAMKIEDKAKRFAQMTSKDMVQNIAKLPGVSKDQYFDWVTTEFSKNLGAELGNLPSYLDSKSTTKLKLHWDDETHRFGVDIPGYKNVQDMDINKIRMSEVQGVPRGFGSSGELRQVVATVKRINSGLGGLNNLAEVTELPVNAYLIHQIQNTGLTDNKFWDAVKTQKTMLKKDQEKPKTE